MKEMQLFEVGFKEEPHNSGYSEKFYVACEEEDSPEEIARGWLTEHFLEYWEEEWEAISTKDLEANNIEPTLVELFKARDEYLEELRNRFCARIHHVGTVVS